VHHINDIGKVLAYHRWWTDGEDILAIIAAWGTPNADITGDNMTNVLDLLLVIGEFGSCP